MEGKTVVITGASAGEGKELTEDGYDKIMQANYLGHFLFTLLLIGLLKKSALSRIINVSSDSYSYAKLDPDDLKNSKKHSDFTVYANSKLANILFTQGLAIRLSGKGVTANSAHPGAVKTSIFDAASGYLSILPRILFIVVGKSREEGAQTSIHLAVDPCLEKVSGKYFRDCKDVKPDAKAMNKELAVHLFEVTEKIVGTSFPET